MFPKNRNRNMLMYKNEYGFQLVTNYEKRIDYVDIEVNAIKSEDIELQKELISYLLKHNNLDEKVFMIKPFPVTEPNLTIFRVDSGIVALQIRRDVIKDFFKSLMDKKNQKYQELKCKMEELQSEVDNLQKEKDILIEKIKEKPRAKGVHKTYSAICCLLCEDIFSINENSENNKWIKADFLKLIENKMKELYPEEPLTKHCFEEFWKIFPEKYKMGSGNPINKKK